MLSLKPTAERLDFRGVAWRGVAWRGAGGVAVGFQFVPTQLTQRLLPVGGGATGRGTRLRTQQRRSGRRQSVGLRSGQPRSAMKLRPAVVKVMATPKRNREMTLPTVI